MDSLPEIKFRNQSFQTRAIRALLRAILTGDKKIYVSKTTRDNGCRENKIFQTLMLTQLPGDAYKLSGIRRKGLSKYFSLALSRFSIENAQVNSIWNDANFFIRNNASIFKLFGYSFRNRDHTLDTTQSKRM